MQKAEMNRHNGSRLELMSTRTLPRIRSLVRRTRGAFNHNTARTVWPDPSSPATAAPTSQLPPVFGDYLAVLHMARTFCLATMPPSASTVLSVGASGSWYFEWFAKTYGDVERHIGIEAFLPRPKGLPKNVEWVAADLASSEGVAAVESSSVDLVFSGQNVEHLWPDQVVAFLVESNRVLRHGGWLVVDSPNRDLTAAYRWTMEEHTIELTPEEASHLLKLAGFEVISMKGLWLCRRFGKLMDLEPPGTAAGTSELLERMMLAIHRPEDSFLWWAEARKVAEPDVVAIECAVRAIFADQWDERVGRMRSNEGSPITLGDGRPGVLLEKGSLGYLLFGPYIALRPGVYELSIELEWADCLDESRPLGVLEIVAPDETFGTIPVDPTGRSGRTVVEFSLELEESRFGIEARLRSTGTATLTAPLTLRITPNPYRSPRVIASPRI